MSRPSEPGTWWRRFSASPESGIYTARVVRSRDKLLWAGGSTRCGMVEDDGLWVERALTPAEVLDLHREAVVARDTLEDLAAAAVVHLGGDRPDADGFTGAVVDIMLVLKKRLRGDK